MQLRIEWGRIEGQKTPDAARLWQGEISLDRGQIGFVRSLGVEADEPGSVSTENGRLSIHPRSSRIADGADIQVTAPVEAILNVEFRDLQNPNAPAVVTTVALAELLAKPVKKDLDKSGNRLTIRRAPGDTLRVVLHRDHLVFSPGETFQIDVEPRLLNEPAGTNLLIRGRLTSESTAAELGVQEQTIRTTADASTPTSIAWQFNLPQAEGVYDVTIEAFEPAALRLFGKPKLVAERRVQLVVIGDRPAAADANAPWAVVKEIDPANPRWYEQFKSWSLLPDLVQGTLGNIKLQPWQGTMGSGVQMPPNTPGGEAHWQAYPLTVVRPGLPHVLEVEVPSDVPQTLGISIVESTSGSQSMAGEESTALDSGVCVTEEALPSPGKWVRHRIVFWPRTKTPIALLTNRSEKTPSVYGKIRILAGPSKLPRAFDSATAPERMLAGYLAKPSLAANFGAPLAVDATSGRALDDWQTFYLGVTHLADYLQSIGYSGQILNVMSQGSTIYPSQLVAPTPTFDSGAAFETAQDPVRKDALELMLRVFDREGLKLIPGLKFNAPLPELEELLRRGGAEAEGVQLIGADGRSYSELLPTRSRVTCYYNPLNERVQNAVVNVVHELVERYNQHPALAGLALEISSESCLLLPGELWGLDDDTIARFQREQNIKVPGEGTSRFAARAQFLARPDRDGKPNMQRDLWLSWRAKTMAQFYRRLQSELTSVRRDATLYLCTSELFDAPETARQLTPALSSNARINEVLLGLGVRTELLRDLRGMVLLRPQRLTPGAPVAEQGSDFELNQSPDVDEQFGSVVSAGQLMAHQPRRLRVSSFEAKSPFGRERTPSDIAAQISPAEARNRERFVHALAVRDLDAMFDGGESLPLGQEDALANFIAAFRRLPVGKYTAIKTDGQGVIVRTLATNNSTFAYVVNDSPWPANVQLQLDLPPGCAVDELSGRRRLPVLPATGWTLALEPFDLMAVKFRDPGVHIKKVEVPLDARLANVLDRKLEDLKQRRATLGKPPGVPPPMLAVLSNPTFEMPAKGSQVPGWSLVNPVRGSIAVEPEGPPQNLPDAANMLRKPAGKQALKFFNQGPFAAVHSEPFPATHTGRLSTCVWLKVEDPKKQPDLQIAIEGIRNGEIVYYRPSNPIGEKSADKISSQWSPFLYGIVDLPTTGLDQLRVRFQMTGAGAVWIDDVQLSDLWFGQEEVLQLVKTEISVRDYLDKGNYLDCFRMLDGYWPRFLSENVPLVSSLAVTRAFGGATPPAPAGQPAQNSNTGAQRKPEQSASRSGNILERLRDSLK